MSSLGCFVLDVLGVSFFVRDLQVLKIFGLFGFSDRRKEFHSLSLLLFSRPLTISDYLLYRLLMTGSRECCQA